jgi:hypothetical protein
VRRVFSPAEIALAEAGSRRIGQPISPRQIERWRQAGYASSLERTRPGRGSGSFWPSRLVDEIAALAEAVTRCKRLDEAVLDVFARGGPVPEHAVRRAYASCLDRLEGQLLAQESAPILARRFLRTTQGTRWKKRLLARGKSPVEALERICRAAIEAGLGGEAPQRQAVEDFLDASGLSAATEERTGEIGPWVDRIPIEKIEAALPNWSIPALRHRIETTSFSDLCRARDHARDLARFISTIAPVLRDTAGTKDALGLAEAAYIDADAQIALLTPSVLIFEEMGLPVARVLRLARMVGPFYKAVAVLLRSMPRYFRRFLGPAGIEALNSRPTVERRRFLLHLRRAIDTNPEESAIVAKGNEIVAP